MRNTKTKIENKPSLKVFNFNEAYVPPQFIKVKKNEYKYLSYGKDNLYDQYLLDLYNNSSPLHKGIINKKVKMSVGFGYEPLTDQRMIEYFNKQDVEKLLLHISMSFEIFNSFAIEVIWSKDGSTFSISYIPISTLRIGLKEDKDEPDYFWYSPDWKNFKKEENTPVYIKSFDPEDRKGRQIYYYSDPGVLNDTEIYSLPNYSSTINYIEMDKEIGQYHLNQLKQGFFPSFLLNFVGVPTEEEQDDFYKSFMKNFKGSESAGKIFMTWSEKDEEPVLSPINYNTTDERFILLQDLAEKNITQGHEVPIALVSSVSGKLGSSDERKELIAEFQSYYIFSRQNQIESVLNELFEILNFNDKIKLKNYASDEQSGVLTQEN